MKGIIFNLLERAVAAEHGEDAWDDVLDAAGSDGVHSAVGQYPDEELLAIVSAAADLLGLTPRDALQWLGTSAIPMLAEAYPAFFAQAPELRLFLTSLNDVIHSEVRKLYPGAIVPSFGFDSGENTLAMTYRSPRSMCDLAVGFARGAAAHYGERVEVGQPSCRLEGDDECVVVVRWTP